MTDMERIAAQFEALKGEYDLYKRTCETALAGAAALQETQRQAYEALLQWVRAGELQRVVGFLEESLADMEADRQQLNA